MPVLRFILQRVVQAILVTLVVTLFVAFAIRLTGDPAVMLAGDSSGVTEQDLARFREALGLNDPFLVQYWGFVKSLVTLDFGQSFFRGSVRDLIGGALPATLLLAAASMAVSVCISIPLGIHSALHKGGISDQLIRVLSLVGLSFPNFWLGIMLVLLFAIAFPILPASGFQSWSALILPATTIGIILTATNVRLVRTQMLETLSAQYVMVARAKGLSEWTVIYKHALRNAAISIVTFLGLQFGNLIGGLVIIELVFNWPGMGTLSIDAISQRDYPLLQATVSILAIMIVAVNLAVDLIYGLIDPRIRVA
ncbi:ABC transporter permease [Falsirhodobacter algicola]|uniref:ABC transporter permease subunit n=1 Tax=Falsirhodobacter algicola TaxID=2692330 RepID=A0A8J8MSE8_9RHOB|nr:ABC transporter permease [Falsirhodobacter algicola]QUS35664.1 ABC transporter permease subunit [Falsirhodobacter algicola]